MDNKIRSITGKSLILTCAIIIILFAIFMPVDYIVKHSIPATVTQEIKAQGNEQHIFELQNRFRAGLSFLRLASFLLSSWIFLLFILWPSLKNWALRTELLQVQPDYYGKLNVKKEIWFPLLWCLAVIAVSWPLLSKGFEHTEICNFLMLAKRGFLVSIACQNMHFIAGQPGYTAVESIFVSLFGGSELVARLPALIIGASAMFPLFFIARRYGSILFANLACFSLAVCGFYLFYNPYAKGYAFLLFGYLFILLIALRLREDSTWRNWIFFGIFIIFACYAHFSTNLHIGCLLIFMLLDRLIRAAKKKLTVQNLSKALIQPIIIALSAVLIIFFLYAVGIPTFREFLKVSTWTDYYTAYNINFRFFKALAESWSWFRDFHIFGWLQALFFILGVLLAFKKRPMPTLYLIGPFILAILLIWFRGVILYPRYLLHFLPFYTLFSLYSIWRLSCRFFTWKAAAIFLCIIFFSAGVSSLKRLYSLERCGVRTAVNDARAMMDKSDRIMGTLDGYITVKYYYPQATSGYRDKDFWKEISSINPPEFIITVPFNRYLELDIPGSTKAVHDKYVLVKKYPGWLDVDSDGDSVYLYRLKNGLPN